MPILTNLLLISTGAATGAVIRWALGLWLADTLSYLALGTLAANWIGAYIIGIAAALIQYTDLLPPQWRLLLITGFLGSLTTFSGFSLEIINMLQMHRWMAAFTTISLHLFGSLLLTLLGMLTVTAFFKG